MRRSRGSVFERQRVAADGTIYTRWIAQASYGSRDKRKVVRRVFDTRDEALAAVPSLSALVRDTTSLGYDVPQIVTRFYSHVSKEGHPKGCWEWTAFRYPTGYGHFSRDGKSAYSHRVALEMSIGRPLDTSEWALHKCDNPACVRVDPDHVYLGNATDNARDRRKAVA